MNLILPARRIRKNALPPPARANAHDSGVDLMLDLSLFDLHALGGSASGKLWMGKRVVEIRSAFAHYQGLKSLVSFQTERLASGHNDLLVLNPGAIVWVRTGYGFNIPPGWSGRVSGRSGAALKNGVTAFHIGVIDPGYQDEIAVGLRNDSASIVRVHHGQRIAQLVVHAVPEQLHVEVVPAFNDAEQGRAGFGSTGTGKKVRKA